MTRRGYLKSVVLTAAVAITVCLSSSMAMAVTSVNLNTGVAGGSSYSLGYIANATDSPLPSLATPFDATVPGGAVTVTSLPSPWLANNATSAWIGPQSNGFGGAFSPVNGTGANDTPFYATGYSSTNSAPQGFMYYTTTFHLDAPGPYVLSGGLWTSDNNGVAIYLNGVSQGQTNPGDYTQLNTTFNIASANFNVGNGSAGDNTLTFVVFNEQIGSPHSSPTGLRVVGSISAVPEPSRIALVISALPALGLIWNRRRRRLS